MPQRPGCDEDISKNQSWHGSRGRTRPPAAPRRCRQLRCLPTARMAEVQTPTAQFQGGHRLLPRSRGFPSQSRRAPPARLLARRTAPSRSVPAAPRQRRPDLQQRCPPTGRAAALRAAPRLQPRGRERRLLALPGERSSPSGGEQAPRSAVPRQLPARNLVGRASRSRWREP